MRVWEEQLHHEENICDTGKNHAHVSAQEIAMAMDATGQVTNQKMRNEGLIFKLQVPTEKGIEVLQRGLLTIGRNPRRVHSLKKRSNLL